VVFCVLLLSILLPILITRWIFRVNVIVNLLEKIRGELKLLNAKIPDRPSPRELSVLSKSLPAENPENSPHILERVRIKPEPNSFSDVTCTKCQSNIPSDEQPHLFAGKVVCKRCDRKLRKKAGLDNSVTTTK